MTEQGRVIPVEIHGQRYPIRTSLEPDYVARLARYVDEKMRAAADSTPSGDALRHAVLAALNIADELFRCRDERRAQDGRLATRAEELERILDRILTPRRAPAMRLGTGRHAPALAPRTVHAKIPRAFEFPALRVMAVGSFEPMFTQVSCDAAWCACLCCEEA